jgi:hypothetical protein
MKLYTSLYDYMIWVHGLSLNIEKTNTVRFNSNHHQNDHVQITHQNKTMKEAKNIKFLWLELLPR